jgi:hypothetical protein
LFLQDNVIATAAGDLFCSIASVSVISQRSSPDADKLMLDSHLALRPKGQAGHFAV